MSLNAKWRLWHVISEVLSPPAQQQRLHSMEACTYKLRYLSVEVAFISLVICVYPDTVYIHYIKMNVYDIHIHIY